MVQQDNEKSLGSWSVIVPRLGVPWCTTSWRRAKLANDINQMDCWLEHLSPSGEYRTGNYPVGWLDLNHRKPGQKSTCLTGNDCKLSNIWEVAPRHPSLSLVMCRHESSLKAARMSNQPTQQLAISLNMSYQVSCYTCYLNFVAILLLISLNYSFFCQGVQRVCSKLDCYSYYIYIYCLLHSTLPTLKGLLLIIHQVSLLSGWYLPTLPVFHCCYLMVVSLSMLYQSSTNCCLPMHINSPTVPSVRFISVDSAALASSWAHIILRHWGWAVWIIPVGYG